MKRHPTEWENIFGNKAADKGLISQNIHTSPATEHQHKQTTNQKMGRESNRHFSKKDIQMAKTHMKRYSTSLVIMHVFWRTQACISVSYITNGRIGSQHNIYLQPKWRVKLLQVIVPFISTVSESSCCFMFLTNLV